MKLEISNKNAKEINSFDENRRKFCNIFFSIWFSEKMRDSSERLIKQQSHGTRARYQTKSNQMIFSESNLKNHQGLRKKNMPIKLDDDFQISFFSLPNTGPF